MRKIILLIIVAIIAITALIFYQTKDVADSPSVISEGELAPVDDIDIMILESFPVQVRVVARGNLANSCYIIGDINEIRQDRHFGVSIKQKMVTEVCAQALVPFEESFSLSVYGLKAGRYTVSVNGVIGEFTFTQDNIIAENEENNSGDIPVLPPGY